MVREKCCDDRGMVRGCVVIIGYGERISIMMLGVLSEDKCCDDRGRVR